MQDMKETKTKKWINVTNLTVQPVRVSKLENQASLTPEIWCDLKFKKVQCNSNHDTILVWLFTMTGKIFHEDY